MVGVQKQLAILSNHRPHLVTLRWTAACSRHGVWWHTRSRNNLFPYAPMPRSWLKSLMERENYPNTTTLESYWIDLRALHDVTNQRKPAVGVMGVIQALGNNSPSIVGLPWRPGYVSARTHAHIMVTTCKRTYLPRDACRASKRGRRGRSRSKRCRR